MKYKITILVALSLFSLNAFAQGSEEVEMADVLRQNGKIYTVVFGLVVILTAMIILLIRVDRRLFHIEQDLKRESEHTTPDNTNLYEGQSRIAQVQHPRAFHLLSPAGCQLVRPPIQG